MKFLQKLVIASLIAIAVIELKGHVATAQAPQERPTVVARPRTPREARPLFRLRRKIALRAERLASPITSRLGRNDRARTQTR